MTRKDKNKLNIEGLHTIRKNGSSDAVIFVHGLRGHPHKTWTKKNTLSLPKLLERDNNLRHYDLFTFGYKTNVILKQHRYQEISELLYTELKARTEYRRIYFIAHSMGGLIVQKLIINGIEYNRFDFINNVKGIIYLSVPFYGAIGGTVAKGFNSIIPPILGDYFISVQVKSLSILGKDLEEQSRKWALHSNKALAKVRQRNIYGLLDRTVRTSSASPAYIQDSYAVHENHRSICKVDEKSTVYQLISKFLQQAEIDELQETKTVELELNKYLEWLKKNTSDFIVPGVNTPLNIEEAWASIQVWEKPIESSSDDTIEIKLKKYHEWDRLSEPDISRLDSQELPLLGKHIILIGGPGSGKSTLVRRTVNQLVSQEKRVLYVKLNRISKEMSQGKSFEDSLWATATEGYTGNKRLFKSILLQPDFLIADGLDECEPNRKEISGMLKEWSKSRTHTQVIITTRPIGYESAYFHNYNHMEILPFNEDEIYRYAPKLIKVITQEGDLKTNFLDRFKHQLEENRTASIAAKSPLLLNFLIQLSVSGKAFGTYRAELYSRILDEWMRNSERGEYLSINPQVALGALEWIGWNLQDSKKNKWGRDEKKIILGLSSFLSEQANVKKLESKELAYKCLKYWTEKGVLEHLKIGHEDAYVFIHLTLGEYAAARYFVNMDLKKQKEEFHKIYRNPIWREVLLLAGGEGAATLLVEEILNLPSEKYDIFNDIVLAASILAETKPIENLIKKALQGLTENICSSIPMLAYEAGKAASNIALHEPELTISLTMPLTKHEQLWTRLVSVYLCLRAGKAIFDTQSYIEWVSKAPEPIFFLKASNPSNPSQHFFWNETILEGLKQILNQGISKKELINVSRCLNKSSFNLRTFREILEIFRKEEAEEAIKILSSKSSFDWKKYNFEEGNNRMKQADLAFLRVILDVIPNIPDIELEQDYSLVQLAKLYEGMNVGEMRAGDLYPLAEGIDLEPVRTVIREMIHVLGIDKVGLFKEIQWALSERSDRIIFNLLPEIPKFEPDWGKVKEAKLNLKYLVEALGHPSNTIAMSAAFLIHEIDDQKLKPLIIAILNDGNERILKYLSLIIPSLYEEEALDLLIFRLQGTYNEGFRYLYEALGKLPGTDYREDICNTLTIGISNTNNLVAKSAAKAMLETQQCYDEKGLKKVLMHWDHQGVLCDRCKIMVKGSSCPNCNVVPPSPIPELLDLLFMLDSLKFEEWLYFSVHDRNDIRKSAEKGLTRCLSLNTDFLIKVISDIKDKNQPAYLLNAILEINPTTLFHYRKVVMTLIESSSSYVRRSLIEYVGNGNWLNKEEAYLITQQALEDEHLDVRDQAILTLRRLDNVI